MRAKKVFYLVSKDELDETCPTNILSGSFDTIREAKELGDKFFPNSFNVFQVSNDIWSKLYPSDN